MSSISKTFANTTISISVTNLFPHSMRWTAFLSISIPASWSLSASFLCESFSSLRFFATFYKNYIYTVFSCCISGTFSLFLSSKVVDGILGILIKLIICLIVSNAILLLIYRKDKTFISAKDWIISKLLKRWGDYSC